ncbi:MAG: PAS domain S-box protein [Anaerolineae bacterium]|nr:PAS domain S-box protein [Anaerolineae bacterium]
MTIKSALSAEILGQIALIQGMVAYLPDKENILRFVCRGLVDVPGVDKIDYYINQNGTDQERHVQATSALLRKIIIKLEGYEHGELWFYLSDNDAFSPYIPFIENLGNMLAVILEERRQRQLNKLILENLEKRVYERTKELEQEIKERKQAEDALRKNEENLRITLDSIGDAVISTNTDGIVTRMNPVAETLTGWKQKEALGRPLIDIFHIVNKQTRKPAANPIAKILKFGKSVELANHTVLVAKGGAEHHIADLGSPIRDSQGRIIGVVLVFRDVTEQLRTEQGLLKVKKLESVGVLAGGIAHDFNNLLTGLFGNIEMAKMALSPNHKSYKYLEAAGRSMDMAINLTKQLLTFAKGGDPVKEVLSIAELITETAQFSLRGSNTKLQTNIDPNLWPIEADKGQLSQVISNLVINADQAMPTGGIITVTAKNVETSAGRSIEIKVQDKGVGIAPQYLEQIFDPYFTTKQKGSGLGLATTYSIINKHNGQIAVDSHINQGTIFTISLPAVEKGYEKVTSEPPIKADTATVSSIRILVMDDEEMIRAVLDTMLKNMGYAVTFTASGQEAIEEYRTAFQVGIPYDIFITDLTIPGGIGGQAVAEKILQLDPQAKIIVSSGYATDPVMANYQAYGFVGIAVKPYRFAELQNVIQQVLET